MTKTNLPPGIYRDTLGYYVRVKVGSGPSALKAYERFSADTAIATMTAWQARARERLTSERGQRPSRGTLAADVREYLRSPDLSAANRARRTQQLAWWCAQPAHLHAPVFTVKAVTEKTATASGPTLGVLPRTKIDPRRIREILAYAFAPTDPERDPTQFAATSNLYRMALYHLFSTLDQDDPVAVNPLRKVKIRPTKGPQLAGQDMRIVREILKHFPSRFGRKSNVSLLRLGVLAWVHITPKQLQQMDPATAFHDVPDATREDMIAGVITVTKPPRHKGRQRRIPAPETIPLTPYGVEALRAFVAEPSAWGSFSLPPLNKAFKRACARAQAALAQHGVTVDLSAMTVYHLKHSLATTASIASAGLVNRQGVLQQSAGVQKALDHAHARTTSIYTQAAVDPILRHVNAATARYLDHLFTVPLAAPAAALKIVK